MRIGEAFLELMPQLSTTSLSAVNREAERAGQRAGQSMGDALARGVERGADAAGQSVVDAGEEAGQRAGDASAEGWADGLKSGAGRILAAGAAIGIGLGAGVVAAMDVSGANDKLRAQLNLTANESGKLGKVAGDLYANNYGASMGEVNDAIASVVHNIPAMRNAAVPVLKDISAGALDVARVFGQDVEGVTRAVGVAMRTGLAPDAQSALDLITRGFQKIPGASEDLLDTMNEYGVQFQKLGLDGPAALGLINQLMQGGARNTDLAADAMKEFSIRAIDGSKLSAEGFKALGLDAEKMTAQIAGGGKGASAGLDLVIDRLNAMEDPVKRDAAGVALFGTQWEDLGQAFRSADLDTAAASLGKTADATKGIADQSDQGRINTFIRSLQTGFVDIVGGKVIPTVLAFGKHLSEHKTLYTTLAITIGVLAAAYGVATAAMAVQAAGGIVAFIKTMVTSTKAWTAAQWLLNVAMTANPIGIVIAVIVALVAAIVIAYKNSETFRKIVQAAWAGIQQAAQYAWENVLKPVFNFIVEYIKIMGNIYTWLWRNIVIPVWNGIKAVISAWWAWAQVVFNALKAIIQVLGAIFTWLWKNIITPVWAGIRLAIQIAWVAIQIVFKAIEIAVRANAAIMQWLWRNVITPVWAGIRAVIDAAWNFIRNNIFNPIINFLRGPLQSAWNFIRSAISAVWGGIRDTLSAGWNFMRTRVFDPLRNIITNTIPNAFRTGVSAVGRAWDGIQEAAKKPVKFVVNTVLNGGIIKGFNWIASKVGVGEIKPISLGFADGGTIFPGYTPGRDVHNFVNPNTGTTLSVSGGEAFMRPEWTKAVGPSFVHGANLAAKTGGTNGVRKYMSEHLKFADGGILGGLKNAWDKFKDPVGTIKGWATSAFNKIPGGQWIASMVRGAAQKLVDGLATWAKDKFTFGIGDGRKLGGGWPSGPGAQRGDSGIWRQIHEMVKRSGIPNNFGNAYRHGDPLWHGSGRAIDYMGYNQDRLAAFFMRMRSSVLELIHTTNQGGYYITRGQRVGSMGEQDALHRNHLHIAMKYGGIAKRLFGFDQGGWMLPGQIGINRLRKPEAVLTPQESAGLKGMAAGELLDKLDELIDEVRKVAPGVGGHIRGAGRSLVAKGRSV